MVSFFFIPWICFHQGPWWLLCHQWAFVILPCHNSGVFDGVGHCFLLEILPFLGFFDKSFPSLSVIMPSQNPVSDASPLSFKDVLQITVLALHRLSVGTSNDSQDFNDHMNRLLIYLYFQSSKTSFDIFTWLAQRCLSLKISKATHHSQCQYPLSFYLLILLYFF